MQRARSLTPNISGLLLQQRLMPAPQANTAGDQASSPAVTSAVAALVHESAEARDNRAQLREVALAVGNGDGGFTGACGRGKINGRK